MGAGVVVPMVGTPTRVCMVWAPALVCPRAAAAVPCRLMFGWSCVRGMVAKEKVALCSFRRGGGPRLVALLPQPRDVDPSTQAPCWSSSCCCSATTQSVGQDQR